jgi:hypothetical protein
MGTSMKSFRKNVVPAAILLLPACVGCNRGNDLDLQEVSGSASFNARPLDNGTVSFSPLDPKGLAGGSVIADGKYLIPRQKGLPPGKYTVRISSADRKSGDSRATPRAPGESPPPLKELLPERYNFKSELSVEVKSGGANTFNFELR